MSPPLNAPMMYILQVWGWTSKVYCMPAVLRHINFESKYAKTIYQPGTLRKVG